MIFVAGIDASPVIQKNGRRLYRSRAVQGSSRVHSFGIDKGSIGRQHGRQVTGEPRPGGLMHRLVGLMLRHLAGSYRPSLDGGTRPLMRM